MTASTGLHEQRTLAGKQVYPIGFGAMLLTLPHPPPGVVELPVPEEQAIRTIHAALDGGVQVIDTAINYCMGPDEMGRNEALVAKALRLWGGDRDAVLVVCKGGNRRTPTEMFVHDGSPANLRWSVETTLRALGAESIGLYMLHAPDPKVPVVESFGALAEMQKEGKIRHVGASNLGRRELSEVRQIVDIVAVENELSPGVRKTIPLLRYCEAEGITFLAYKPLGGQRGAADLDRTYPAISVIARERGVSPQRVALAWSLAQSPNVIPIPAARRPETITDSAAAARLRLTAEELAAIERGTNAAVTGTGRV